MAIIQEHLKLPSSFLSIFFREIKALQEIEDNPYVSMWMFIWLRI